MKLRNFSLTFICGTALLLGTTSFTSLPTSVDTVVSVAQNDLITIKQFLAMLDGSEKAAEAAVAKYGTKEVIANGMIPYGKNPTIVSHDGNCCIVSLDYEDEANQYSLCEENGKIITFEMYFGDEDED